MPHMDQCSVSSCERSVRARGLCGMHYQRAQKAGELAPLTYRGKGYPPCSVDGCEERASSLNLCEAHYSRHKYDRDRDKILSRNKAYTKAHPEVHAKVHAQNEARRQAASLETAHRLGYHWASWELELAADPRRTRSEVAKLTGRSRAAVRSMRSRLRNDPATISRAGIADVL